MYKLNINSIFVSVFGVGYIPFASGTFGSLAGLIIGYLIYLINYNLLFLAIPILFILGIIASDIYQNKTGEQDSKVIVIDDFSNASDLVIIDSTFSFNTYSVLRAPSM